MGNTVHKSQIKPSWNSSRIRFSISILGFLITFAYIPLELGIGLIRTSISIVFLAGVLVFLTKSFQKIDSIDVILLLLGCWITLILLIFPSITSTAVNWDLYLGEVGSLVAGGLSRKLCRDFSPELIRGLGYGLIAQVFIGVYQVLIGPRRLNGLGYVYPRFIFEPGGGFSRAFGSFFSPVVYGSFMAVLGIGLCGYYVNQKKKFNSIVMLTFVAIILSETRGALIAFLIGIIVLIVNAKKTSRSFSVIIPTYMFIVGLLTLSLFATDSEFLERNAKRILSISSLTTDDSVLTRKEMWREASGLIATNPIIGGGTKSLIGEFGDSTPLLQVFKHPHSTYFFVALVYGLFPGFLLFLLLLWKLGVSRNGYVPTIVFMIAGSTETIWSVVNMMVLLILLSEIAEQK